jgi:hypothetical protein
LFTAEDGLPKIRNSKHEIRNKSGSRNPKLDKPLMLLTFRISDLVLVSDFDIRISGFSKAAERGGAAF